MSQFLKIDYFELSAKTGENVENLFFHLIDMFNEGKSNGTNNILDNIKELPEETRNQENAIDDIVKLPRKNLTTSQMQQSS